MSKSPWNVGEIITSKSTFADIVCEQEFQRINNDTNTLPKRSQYLKDQNSDDDKDFELAIELSLLSVTDFTASDDGSADIEQVTKNKSSQRLFDHNIYDSDFALALQLSEEYPITSHNNLVNDFAIAAELQDTYKQDFVHSNMCLNNSYSKIIVSSLNVELLSSTKKICGPDDCDSDDTVAATIRRNRDADSDICDQSPSLNQIVNRTFPRSDKRYEENRSLDSMPFRVMNNLKLYHQRKTIKGMTTKGKVEKSASATTEYVMDPQTRILLFKLIQNSTLQSICGVIKTGKEASIYQAIGMLPFIDEEGNESTGDENANLAIKIFKTTLNKFSNRKDYYDNDHRFRHSHLMKWNHRSAIKKWSEKEFRNLIRAHSCGLRVPQPVIQKNHILIMSLIGTTNAPAPQLAVLAKGNLSSDTRITNEKWTNLFFDTLATMYILYNDCKLVHGDLSEYNLLYHDDRVWTIDFGQAVDLSHPAHDTLLMRDIHVISCFFRKAGVAVSSDENLFEWLHFSLNTLRKLSKSGIEDVTDLVVDIDQNAQVSTSSEALDSDCEEESIFEDYERSIIATFRNLVCKYPECIAP